MKKKRALIPVSLIFFTFCVLAQKEKNTSENVMKEIKKQPEKPPQKVVKTTEEWKDQLSSEEFRVLREAGTEPANSPIYEQFKKQGKGIYFCAGCNAELFSSEGKFDSGSGWPSFFTPSEKENIKEDVDYHIGYKRVEVRCKKCDGHLGHVFEGEGFETPTDKRYCVNGVCLKFLPEKP